MAQALGVDYEYRERPVSAPPGSRGLRLGDSVRIAGMSRRQELNGMSGILVQDCPDDAGRVCVHIPATSQMSGFLPLSPQDAGKVMRIRADRLRAPNTLTPSASKSASSIRSTGESGRDR